MNNNSQALLSEYDVNQTTYQLLVKKIEVLITELLNHQSVGTHKIESRVKGRESLQQKVSRPDKNYSTLSDIKDICGIRVIVLFEDQVEAVAQTIEQHFAIDLKHSVDKRKLLAPDSFGYLSLHYVCCLSDERTKLTEYSAYKEIPLEIQIRSILQHAWAEIEHDLGYKSSISIPSDLRRKFSRVAGLLEIADEEFVEIRQKLTQYRRQVATSIATCPNLVMVDNVSLQAFIESNVLVKDIDNRLADRYGICVEAVKAQNYYDHLTKLLSLAKMYTIGDLESELSLLSEEVVEFGAAYDAYTNSTFGYSMANQERLPLGRSVLLLPYLIVLKASVPDVVRLQNLKDFFRQVEGDAFAHGLNPEKNADERATRLSHNLFHEYQKLSKPEAS